MKRSVIILITAFLCMPIIAQEEFIDIYLSDGTIETYATSDIDSIVHEDDTAINGYEFVDLGLSVMWASCNVGADSPEDYGNYYAWGETNTKSTYTSSNCTTYYVSLSDISGNATYDAATSIWGSPWRLPTKAELYELVDSCQWTWTTQDGVYGYLVSSDEGASIFLPAAGFRMNSSRISAGSKCYYWSSTPDNNNLDSAWGLSCDESTIAIYTGYERYYGMPLRPVADYESASYNVNLYLSDGSIISYPVSTVDSMKIVESSADGKINGYEYVDLGLSVKWAACNLGADSPEDYGNYYAWGETETKSSYTTANSVTYGVSMSDISGNATYDAATANWGSSWRLPTNTEKRELVNKCTWEWTTQNGVNGYLITGPNEHTIFLPAAGNKTNSSSLAYGSAGRYWTSTPSSSTTDNTYAYGFNFGSSLLPTDYDNLFRNYGLTIRAVSD